MSRTKHHQSIGKHWRDPAWYRRDRFRRWRAKHHNLLRTGRYDDMLRRIPSHGYYW